LLGARLPPEPSANLQFSDEPTPEWLADLAEAVSGQSITSDEQAPASLSLQSIRDKYNNKANGPYAVLWKRIFMHLD
jgi:hypothetical protein